MSHFADTATLEHELVAFFTAFLGSEDGARAREAARALGDQARLVLRTTDPDAVVSVDFFENSVSLDVAENANIEIVLEADVLHDILLGRMDPVQISRMYETDRLTFRGTATDLAALIVLAGPLQPHYPASLERRGRTDLLDTPLPERHTVWTTGPDVPPRAIINSRRAWQRPKRAAAST
jgi:hypothetical protein